MSMGNQRAGTLILRWLSLLTIVATTLGVVYWQLRQLTQPSVPGNYPEWSFHVLTGVVLALLFENISHRRARENDLEATIRRTIEDARQSSTAGFSLASAKEDRAHLYRELALSATREVAILGTTCTTVATIFGHTGIDGMKKLTRERRVRILMLDPAALTGSFLKALALTHNENEKEFAARTKRAYDTLKRLEGELGERFTVRTYATIPTYNTMLIDGTLEAGKALIELPGARHIRTARPRVFISPGAGGWFEQVRSTFEYLWESGAVQ